MSDDIRDAPGVRDLLGRLTEEVREMTGDDSLEVDVDDTPLLSAEKRERRWPDDFRGFGSNVAPKKRRRG